MVPTVPPSWPPRAAPARAAVRPVTFAPLVLHAFELAGVDGRGPAALPPGDGRRRPALVERHSSSGRADGGHRGVAPQPLPHAHRRRHGGAPPRPGRGLGGRGQRGQPAGRLAAPRSRPSSSRRSGGPAWCSAGCRPARCAGTSAARPTPSAPSSGRSPTAWASLPYANGVHYDSEAQRRPLFQRLIAEGTLPDGYATDDGVGLVYRGTELVEAVTEVPGRGAYRVRREGDAAVEERIEPRRLPGAA